MLNILLLFIWQTSISWAYYQTHDNNLSFSIDNKPKRFYIDYNKGSFMKDGEPFQIISGSIHYFRVVSEHWSRAFQLAKSAGLNAIQT